MDNKQLSRLFRLQAHLLELHEENPFKVNAVASAAIKIDKSPVLLWDLSHEALHELGLGKSLARKIETIRTQGTLPEWVELQARTPPGIIEMLALKGLGPKKSKVIWKVLEIETLADLYYACNENRLTAAPGFGLKTQGEIKAALEFSFLNKGKFTYGLAYPIATQWLARLQGQADFSRVDFTGSLRRKCEVLDRIELAVLDPGLRLEAYLTVLAAGHQIEHLEKGQLSGAELTRDLTYWDFRSAGLPVRIYQTEFQFDRILLLTTGSSEHLAILGPIPVREATESAYYADLGLPYIEPELREGRIEFERAKQLSKKPLVRFEDLRGSIHNHSTYSDGVHTMLEMAEAAQALGLAYLVISDHSQSAFYARGLKPERVQAQHAEIDSLNKSLSPFRIFKAIESDILWDGNLDYPDEILAGFELVIASIHSNLRMDLEKATDRLIRAVENPYTTILGHPTGRLLLGRPGYPIDHQRVIDACAASNVVLEINANPNRLDLDWRWIDYARSKGVMLSINPDAHRTQGLLDMHYGLNVARKGGLTAKECLNTFSLAEFSAWVDARRVQFIPRSL